MALAFAVFLLAVSPLIAVVEIRCARRRCYLPLAILPCALAALLFASGVSILV